MSAVFVIRVEVERLLCDAPLLEFEREMDPVFVASAAEDSAALLAYGDVEDRSRARR